MATRMGPIFSFHLTLQIRDVPIKLSALEFDSFDLKYLPAPSPDRILL